VYDSKFTRVSNNYLPLNLYHFTPQVVIFQDDFDIDMLVGGFVYILKN